LGLFNALLDATVEERPDLDQEPAMETIYLNIQMDCEATQKSIWMLR